VKRSLEIKEKARGRAREKNKKKISHHDARPNPFGPFHVESLKRRKEIERNCYVLTEEIENSVIFCEGDITNLISKCILISSRFIVTREC
jgi:hypothetical protein